MTRVALPPHMSRSLWGCGMHLQRSTFSVMVLATSNNVTLPSMLPGLSPLNTTLVDLNVIVGNSATLKKSGVRKCSSRERGRFPLSLSPVLTDEV